MRNRVSSSLAYLSFIFLLWAWVGAAEQSTPAGAEVPAPEQPVEVRISEVCTSTGGMSKVMGEFARTIDARKEPVSGFQMKVELLISPAGYMNQIKVLEATDEELSRLAFLLAGQLRCKATGHMVRTVYPVVFSVVDE